MDKKRESTDKVRELDVFTDEEIPDFSETRSKEFVDDQEENKPKKFKHFFHSHKEDGYYLRDKWILERIRDEDLMEYLLLEQKRNEQFQNMKNIHEKRITATVQLTFSLTAGVIIVYLLKDNPTILISIIYISGFLGIIWFWKSHVK